VEKEVPAGGGGSSMEGCVTNAVALKIKVDRRRTPRQGHSHWKMLLPSLAMQAKFGPWGQIRERDAVRKRDRMGLA
jgi:hypothetical protein